MYQFGCGILKMVGPKKYFFGQESTYHQKKFFKKILRGMSVRQKLGVILESKVIQKLSLEKKFFLKNGLLNYTANIYSFLLKNDLLN